MAREKHKRRKPRGESNEAEHWGGPIRISDEGPVMGLERRDRVSGVRRESHAPFCERPKVQSLRPTLPFICGKTRRGRFLLRRKSRGDRMRAKLKEIKA